MRKERAEKNFLVVECTMKPLPSSFESSRVSWIITRSLFSLFNFSLGSWHLLRFKCSIQFQTLQRCEGKSDCPVSKLDETAFLTSILVIFALPSLFQARRTRHPTTSPFLTHNSSFPFPPPFFLTSVSSFSTSATFPMSLSPLLTTLVKIS